MNFEKDFWWKLSLTIPFDLEESFVWKLNQLLIKTFATQIDPKEKNQVIFFIWLPSHDWPSEKRQDLVESFYPLAETFRTHISKTVWEKVHHEDWSVSWRKHWKPLPVGDSLLILPAWIELPDKFLNRTFVKLDPGAAFGTGEHPTTRLCLEALERFPLMNLRIADVGCGSGVLGLAALKLGAKEVIGVDIDPLAIRAAQENIRLNNFDQKEIKVFEGSVNCLQDELQGVKADLLLCNILAPVIKNLTPDFENIISLEGHAFFSGLLVDQIPVIKNHLIGFGWHVIASYQLENWSLLHLCKNSLDKKLP